MKYQKLVEDILANVGGVDNVNSVTHCVTRLRFKLKEESKANTKALKALDGVMEIIQAGGQYQVVIGTHVDEVYKEVIAIGGFEAKAPVPVEEEANEQTGLLNRFLGLMSGIFQPVLSINDGKWYDQGAADPLYLGWHPDQRQRYLYYLEFCRRCHLLFLPCCFGLECF